MAYLNRNLIKGMFPSSYQHVKYAFVAAHVKDQSHLLNLAASKTPEFDLILAVDDHVTFHDLNLEENRSHYTMFVQVLQTQMRQRPTDWLHKYGIKMHFNTIKIKEDDLLDMADEDEESEDNREVKFRYGIISVDDLHEDLNSWHTLIPSAILQRPHVRIIDDLEKDFEESQQKNLQSAIAYAALNANTKDDGSDDNEVQEQEFYEKIAELPFSNTDKQYLHFHNKKHIENEFVENNLDQYKQMYGKVIQEDFADYLKVDEDKGQIEINLSTTESIMELFDKLNFKFENREEMVEKLEKLDKTELQKEINELIKKEMTSNVFVKQGKAKIFHFMLTGWFYFFFWLFRKSIQISVALYVYQKAKGLNQGPGAPASGRSANPTGNTGNIAYQNYGDQMLEQQQPQQFQRFEQQSSNNQMSFGTPQPGQQQSQYQQGQGQVVNERFKFG